MKVGDLVTWPLHDPGVEACGVWEVRRVGHDRFDDRRGTVATSVTLRWICGWKRYFDQRRARIRLEEVHLIEDPVSVICQVADNELMALALATSLGLD